jgi:hypothetical protein
MLLAHQTVAPSRPALISDQNTVTANAKTVSFAGRSKI